MKRAAAGTAHAGGGFLKWKWKKLGRIFKPDGRWWMVTHAQAPFVESAGEGLLRVHFSGRDRQNRSRGGWFDLDLGPGPKVVSACDGPTLGLGAPGAFDDCGAMPSWIVSRGRRKFMYYTGWSLAVTTPFTFFIGLAVSEDGGATWNRFSQAPVLGRGMLDPFLTCSPCVLVEDRVWRMWYVSGTGWEAEGGGGQARKHYYLIKYAESRDGIAWKTLKEPCISFEKGEYALARPVVNRIGGRYAMWFSHRAGDESYRIGYAESGDGRTWERADQSAGIGVSERGWDSGMVCYPCVFMHGGEHYMLYNGNDYGATGIGLAKAALPD